MTGQFIAELILKVGLPAALELINNWNTEGSPQWWADLPKRHPSLTLTYDKFMSNEGPKVD